jgi:hypothetical protein
MILRTNKWRLKLAPRHVSTTNSWQDALGFYLFLLLFIFRNEGQMTITMYNTSATLGPIGLQYNLVFYSNVQYSVSTRHSQEYAPMTSTRYIFNVIELPVIFWGLVSI